jgi:hypothetical protein
MVLDTSGLSSEILHVGVPLILIELICVNPAPWQRVGGVPLQMSQVRSPAITGGSTLIVFVRTTGLVPQLPVTVSVIVASPVKNPSQKTTPDWLMCVSFRLLVLDIVHSGDPA